jgi:hypothetical protein
MIQLTDLTQDHYFDDSLAIINSNFNSVEEELNSITEVFDLSSKEAEVSKITVKSGEAASIADVLISTNGSVSAGGNITSQKNMVANAVMFNESLVGSGGKMKLNGGSVMHEIEGGVSQSASVLVPGSLSTNFASSDIATATVDAVSTQIGLLKPSNYRSLIEISFSLQSGFCRKLQLSKEAMLPGHQLTLVAKFPDGYTYSGTDGASKFVLLNRAINTRFTTSILNSTATTGYVFTENWSSMTLVARETGWIITGLYGVSVVSNYS